MNGLTLAKLKSKSAAPFSLKDAKQILSVVKGFRGIVAFNSQFDSAALYQ